MRRLNVRQAQLQECIEESMFALGSRPSLQNGEILLLQLVKGDAKQAGQAAWANRVCPRFQPHRS